MYNNLIQNLLAYILFLFQQTIKLFLNLLLLYYLLWDAHQPNTPKIIFIIIKYSNTNSNHFPIIPLFINNITLYYSLNTIQLNLIHTILSYLALNYYYYAKIILSIKIISMDPFQILLIQFIHLFKKILIAHFLIIHTSNLIQIFLNFNAF